VFLTAIAGQFGSAGVLATTSDLAGYISGLPAASSAGTTDELPSNQSGTTRKVTVAQLSTVLASTTQTLTNKTLDTADTGNSFKINGTTVSAVTGGGSTALLAPSVSGNSGKYLTNDGSATSWGPLPVGLTLLSTLTASNSATLDDVINITTTYKHYFLLLSNIRPASNGMSLFLRVTSNSGTSWHAGHPSIYENASNTSGGYALLSGPGVNSTTVTQSPGISNNNNYGVSGMIHMSAPSSGYPMLVSDLVFRNSAVGTVTRAFGASILPETGINGVRMGFDGGNIVSGDVRIYGVKS
jgi:hypothetical protein